MYQLWYDKVWTLRVSFMSALGMMRWYDVRLLTANRATALLASRLRGCSDNPNEIKEKRKKRRAEI
jgi:hypothetical protein